MDVSSSVCTLITIILYCFLRVEYVWSYCPCETEDLCKPINATSRKEVFVFTKNGGDHIWREYDWTKITTVVQVGFISSRLMCHAHKHNVRIVFLSRFSKRDLSNSTLRENWINRQLMRLRNSYLDGINVDFEEPIIQSQGLLRDAFTSLVKEANTRFKEEFPSSQVTVDVAWSPNCIDRRCYDYVALSVVSDFLLVMSYDHRSQIFERCVAAANSGYYTAQEGIEDYLDLGIFSNKLVLGLPWYGMKYPCLDIDEDNICFIPYVSYLGAFCSHKAGTQMCFSDIYPLADESASGRMWDNQTLSPFFIHTDPSAGQTFQFWYDDAESLTAKFGLADRLNLRGVGIWRADCLDYSDAPAAIATRDEMWKAVPLYDLHGHDSSSSLSFVFD